MSHETKRGAIITVCHTKGGASKSTSTINLAAYFASLGTKVLILDADKIATCSKWHGRREEARDNGADLARVTCIQKLGNIKSTALDMAQDYELVLIDAAGRDSQELRVACLTADIILLPVQASTPDLDALDDMEEVLKFTEDLHPNRTVMAFLSNIPTHAKSTKADTARAYMESEFNIPLMAAKLHTREAYKDAITAGKGVSEYRDPKAKTEIAALATEILNYV